MAVAASGKDVQTLFSDYLYKPFNMTQTTWTPLEDPQLAVGITTTGDDFEQLLHRLLTYAATHPDETAGLRFDVTAKKDRTPPTTDVAAVFAAALYPWDPRRK